MERLSDDLPFAVPLEQSVEIGVRGIGSSLDIEPDHGRRGSNAENVGMGLEVVGRSISLEVGMEVGVVSSRQGPVRGPARHAGLLVECAVEGGTIGSDEAVDVVLHSRHNGGVLGGGDDFDVLRHVG